MFNFIKKFFTDLFKRNYVIVTTPFGSKKFKTFEAAAAFMLSNGKGVK